jgi:hypothetical protein
MVSNNYTKERLKIKIIWKAFLDGKNVVPFIEGSLSNNIVDCSEYSQH